MFVFVVALHLLFALRCAARRDRDDHDPSDPTDVTIPVVEQAFDNARIVPDVLLSFTPTSILDVDFIDPDSSKLELHSVTPGIQLSMEQTLLAPRFSLSTNDISIVNEKFVIALVDPDAPTPQNKSLSQFRHFLGGDFHLDGSSTIRAPLVNSSAALTEYVNPTPPIGSDAHRYVILLFVQPTNFDTVARNFVAPSTPRPNFDLATFVEEAGLGAPIAGTFFLTRADVDGGTSSGGVGVPATATATNTVVIASSPSAGGRSVPTSLGSTSGANASFMKGIRGEFRRACLVFVASLFFL